MNKYFKIINEMFYFIFGTKSLKSSVLYLTARPNLD